MCSFASKHKRQSCSSHSREETLLTALCYNTKRRVDVAAEVLCSRTRLHDVAHVPACSVPRRWRCKQAGRSSRGVALKAEVLVHRVETVPVCRDEASVKSAVDLLQKFKSQKKKRGGGGLGATDILIRQQCREHARTLLRSRCQPDKRIVGRLERSRGRETRFGS